MPANVSSARGEPARGLTKHRRRLSGLWCLRRLALTTARLSIFCLAGIAAGADSEPDAPAQSWTEDFNSLDADKTWLIQLYSFDASGCNFVPEMLQVQDSVLSIQVRKNPHPELPKPYDGGDMGSNEFRSYGLYSVRMRASAARGTVSAFFLMNRWQPAEWEHKEIDIEFLGKDTRRVQLTTHDFQKGGTVWKSSAKSIDLPFDWSADFHEYAILWTPESVTWFADGVRLRTTRDYVPHEPLQIRANYYAGDPRTPGIREWLGPLQDADLPAHTDYDWIRFVPLQDVPPQYR
jgi:endo-1,3-1,4-beta-glycanase ExoK